MLDCATDGESGMMRSCRKPDATALRRSRAGNTMSVVSLKIASLPCSNFIGLLLEIPTKWWRYSCPLLVSDSLGNIHNSYRSSLEIQVFQNQPHALS